jgi:hypothetical protein
MSVNTGRILLTAILVLPAAYTLIITPIRELIGRAKRCTPKNGAAAHPDWRTELLILWRSVNTALSGPALLHWLVLLITLIIFAPGVITITKAGLLSLRATLQDARYFRGKIGQPLKFQLPEEGNGEAFILQPLGSTRSCALTSGDVGTILNDERNVDVVSSTGSLCPPHYTAQLSWRILSGLRGQEKNGGEPK